MIVLDSLPLTTGGLTMTRRASCMTWAALGVAISVLCASDANAACCYFSAKNADILQPAQKAFLTWNPEEKLETFTVQPKFEGNALDFGMVIPTPSQPKLSEMPRDFFKHLAVYTVMKRREFSHSDLRRGRPELFQALNAAPAAGDFEKAFDLPAGQKKK